MESSPPTTGGAFATPELGAGDENGLMAVKGGVVDAAMGDGLGGESSPWERAGEERAYGRTTARYRRGEGTPDSAIPMSDSEGVVHGPLSSGYSRPTRRIRAFRSGSD